MAEITNHILFARKIKEKIKSDNDNLFLYSVGPDSFYFSRDTRLYGKMMHKSKSKLFFKNFVLYIKNNNLKDDKDVINCLYGFITHYVLDYTIHPYVFYKTGIFNRNDKSTYKYLDGHRWLEMGITKYYYKNISKLKMHEFMNISFNKNIKEALDYTFKNTFNIENGYNKYIKSYNNMRSVYKIFRYDKYGIKKRIYKFLDLFRKSKLSLISFYNIDKVDLNEKKDTWYNPSDKNIKYTYNVEELFLMSENKTIELINLVDNLINDNIDINEFDKLFPDVSYLNGIEGNKRLYIFE